MSLQTFHQWRAHHHSVMRRSLKVATHVISLRQVSSYLRIRTVSGHSRILWARDHSRVRTSYQRVLSLVSIQLARACVTRTTSFAQSPQIPRLRYQCLTRAQSSLTQTDAPWRSRKPFHGLLVQTQVVDLLDRLSAATLTLFKKNYTNYINVIYVIFLSSFFPKKCLDGYSCIWSLGFLS